MRVFTNSLEGIFLSRPNRFIVLAETPLGVIRAHCPNPGRLFEILIPGRRLIFEASPAEKRKTSFTLVAAYYREKVVPLYSGRANTVAEKLVLPMLFPQARSILPEQTWGKSRFDFLVTENSRSAYVEVKACTLVEYGTAMFPDAPTVRGRKHVQELAVYTRENRKNHGEGHIIFMIMQPDAERFIPNIHTDPLFSEELAANTSNLTIHAVSTECTAQGNISIVSPDIGISMEFSDFGVKNRGVYLLIVALKTASEIEAGKLGKRVFPPGYYVYAGSAKKNLSQRVSRHKRKMKKMHWHIDYLTAAGDSVKAFPVFTGNDLECRMAEDLSAAGGTAVKGFGSSDCSCPAHLFWFTQNPMHFEPFLNLLLYYRHSAAFEPMPALHSGIKENDEDNCCSE